MNRWRTLELLLAICAVPLVIACGDDSPTPQGPTPQAPAAPTGLIATPSLPTGVDLRWTDNASNEVGFRIEQAPGGTTAFTEIARVAAGRTGFQSTGLSAETAYAYRIRAFNAAGPSGYSNIATATAGMDLSDLEGTWTLDPRVPLDCGLRTMVLDTAKMRMQSSSAMTFTLKGQLSPYGEVLEGSANMELGGAENTFTVLGEKTYSYGSFRFRLNGGFASSSSFSGTLWVTGKIQVGTRPIACEGGEFTVIGTRVMGLFPAP